MESDSKPFVEVAFLVMNQATSPSAVVDRKVAEESEAFGTKSPVDINAQWHEGHLIVGTNSVVVSVFRFFEVASSGTRSTGGISDMSSGFGKGDGKVDAKINVSKITHARKIESHPERAVIIIDTSRQGVQGILAMNNKTQRL